MLTDAHPNPHLVPDMDEVAASRWRAMHRQSSPWLNEEIADRMADRLVWIKQTPELWVDWSPLLGGQKAHRRIRDLYPSAKVLVGGDAAQEQVRHLYPQDKGLRSKLAQWRQNIGLAPASPSVEALASEGQSSVQADMVWANMALQWVNDPMRLLRQWNGLLNVGGFLMFSGLGPDTLKELRAVYASQGWSHPHTGLTDMHDWGDMLIEAGFAEPVMGMEHITLTYPHAQALIKDLRETGRNTHAGRHAALRGRGYLKALERALESGLPRTAEGQLRVTVEVIYGHAFKGMPKIPVAPTSEMTVDAMRAMLRGSGAKPPN